MIADELRKWADTAPLDIMRPGEIQAAVRAIADLADRPRAPENALRHITRLNRLEDRRETQAQQVRSADNTARGEQAALDAERDAAAIRWALAERERLLEALEEVRHYTAQGNPADAHEVACCAIGTEGKT